jgi:drug/metabolite transporter (DMT)-like permease
MFKAFIEAKDIHPSRALLYIAFSAALWSTSGLFIKLIDLNPLAIAGLRSAIAAAFMLLLMRGRLNFKLSFPQVSGALAYAVTMVLFVSATKMTTAANAILLQYTAPVFTALLGAWLLKEKVTRFDWLIIGLVIGGMFLFFFDKLSLSGFWGNIMAIGSGLTMSYFIVCMRMQKKATPMEIVMMGNLITMLICLPFYFQKAPAILDWAILIYMGMLQIGLSFIIFSIAIKFVTALEAVLIQTIDPLLNPIWVWLIIGETPGRWALIGGVIVLASVTLRNIFSNTRVPKEAPIAS